MLVTESRSDAEFLKEAFRLTGNMLREVRENAYGFIDRMGDIALSMQSTSSDELLKNAEHAGCLENQDQPTVVSSLVQQTCHDATCFLSDGLELAAQNVLSALHAAGDVPCPPVLSWAMHSIQSQCYEAFQTKDTNWQ